MTDLPKGWRLTTLDEIGKWGSGGTPRSTEPSYYDGTIPWIRSGDLPDGSVLKHEVTITDIGLEKSAAKWVPPESLLIALYGATIGKLGITTYPVTTNQAVAFCIPNKELTTSEFLFWYLLRSRSALVRLGQGGAQPNISQTLLKKYAIPLPDLKEQARILEKLKSAMNSSRVARTELQRILRLVERYKKAILAAAFRGDLTADWRTTHPEAIFQLEDQEPSSTRGRKSKEEQQQQTFTPPYEIPRTWQWTPLPKLGQLDRGRSRHRPRNAAHLFGGPYPFIQTGDVRAARGRLTTFSQTYSEAGFAQSRLWPEGTLCITIAANIAETAILGIEACFPDSVVGFLANKGVCDAEYVELFLRTVKGDLEAFAPATAQKNINLETLRIVRVPTPSFQEQQEIIHRVHAYFSRIDEVTSEVERANSLLDRFDQATLDKAFRGELPCEPEQAKETAA